MGDIGDEVCAQGLHTGQLLHHAVKIVDNDIEARLHPAQGRNSGAEIAVHDLLCSVDNALYRALHRDLAAQQIYRRADQAQHKHIAEGNRCRRADILGGKFNLRSIAQISHEQCHGACQHKGDQQKEDTEQLKKGDPFAILFLIHLSTAL